MWLVGAGALAGNIPVSTVAGLRAALTTASAGTEIRLAPGDYVLDSALVIPDRVTLAGSGQMAAGAGGRDGGTHADGPATLLVRGAWSGNAIELGHRSALRRLRVVDEAGADGGRVTPDMARNLVVVGSRHPGDLVEASIQECELSTWQPFGVGRTEPLGRAVGVWTRNPAGAGPVHTGATVRLKLVRSTIVAPRSNALMAINFAALGTVEIRVVDSRIEGVLSAAGGTSRPDPVTGARTMIRSRHSEYVAAGEFNRFGWHLFGGSGVPHPGFATPAGADDNRLHMKSEGDRIEGFQVGILAAAGRRVGGLSGPSSGNRLDLELRGVVIRTEGEQAADVRWYGALAEPGPGGEDSLPPGEGNVMTVRITGTTGSGPRGNRYAGQEGPAPAARDDAGNRLRVRGTADRFRRFNPGLSPVPSDGHFIEGGR